MQFCDVSHLPAVVISKDGVPVPKLGGMSRIENVKWRIESTPESPYTTFTLEIPDPNGQSKNVQFVCGTPLGDTVFFTKPKTPNRVFIIFMDSGVVYELSLVLHESEYKAVNADLRRLQTHGCLPKQADLLKHEFRNYQTAALQINPALLQTPILLENPGGGPSPPGQSNVPLGPESQKAATPCQSQKNADTPAGSDIEQEDTPGFKRWW